MKELNQTRALKYFTITLFIFILVISIFALINIIFIKEHKYLAMKEIVFPTSDPDSLLILGINQNQADQKGEILLINKNDTVSYSDFKFSGVKLTKKSKSLFGNEKGIISLITILFSVFTAIFGIFIFLIQHNLSRAEKIQIDYEKQILKNKEDVKYHESLLNEGKKVLSTNKTHNRKFLDLWFLIANQFLPTSKRPKTEYMRDILELYDPERVQFAALNLRANGDKSCILFLKDRIGHYSVSTNSEDQRILNLLLEALASINKRCSKNLFSIF